MSRGVVYDAEKSGEGYFVLKGEYYDAIEMGRKTTEWSQFGGF